jgi:hypothetical protein
MAFVQDPGEAGGSTGGAGGSTGGGGGGPRNGSGSGGSGPYINPGAARDLSIKLDPVALTLTLTLTPNDTQLAVGGVSYSIWWLDPKKFSQNDIYGYSQLTATLGYSFKQGRQLVATLPSGTGPISYTTQYAPYSTGGWMYATVSNLAGTEYNIVGTNFVAVPSAYSLTGGTPLIGERPIQVSVNYSTIGTNLRRVSFGWTNGPSLATTAYVQIVVQNYWNDGFYREVAVYSINTKPGARQGVARVVFNSTLTDTAQSIVLEPDSSVGAHNVFWYFVPLTSAGVPLAIGNCNFVGTTAIS